VTKNVNGENSLESISVAALPHSDFQYTL